MIYLYYKDLNIGQEFHKLKLPETDLKKELKEISEQSPELYTDYLRESEYISDIIYDYKIVDEIYRYKASSLYNNYTEWCKINKEKNWSNTKFGNYLKNNLNIECVKMKYSNYYVI